MASRRANFQLHGPTHARSIIEAEKGDMNALSQKSSQAAGFDVLHPSIHPSMNPSIHGSTTEQKVLQGTSIRSLQLHSAYAYACEACPPDWVDDKCLTEMGGRHHSLTNLIRWFQPHN
jgi:hypothetical protein